MARIKRGKERKRSKGEVKEDEYIQYVQLRNYSPSPCPWLTPLRMSRCSPHRSMTMLFLLPFSFHSLLSVPPFPSSLVPLIPLPLLSLSPPSLPSFLLSFPPLLPSSSPSSPPHTRFILASLLMSYDLRVLASSPRGFPL